MSAESVTFLYELQVSGLILISLSCVAEISERWSPRFDIIGIPVVDIQNINAFLLHDCCSECSCIIPVRSFKIIFMDTVCGPIFWMLEQMHCTGSVSLSFLIRSHFFLPIFKFCFAFNCIQMLHFGSVHHSPSNLLHKRVWKIWVHGLHPMQARNGI